MFLQRRKRKYFDKKDRHWSVRLSLCRKCSHSVWCIRLQLLVFLYVSNVYIKRQTIWKTYLSILCYQFMSFEQRYTTVAFIYISPLILITWIGIHCLTFEQYISLIHTHHHTALVSSSYNHVWPYPVHLYFAHLGKEYPLKYSLSYIF